MKITCLLLMLVCFASNLVSQENGRLLGIVTHAESGDSLADVTVTIRGAALTTSTNAKGAYLIENILPGKHTVVFSKEEFADTTRQISIDSGQAKRLDVTLWPDTSRAKANRILAASPSPIGVQSIKPQKVKRIVGSLDDINRVVDFLSGTASSGDYTAAYAVRGGTLDQNVIYLDGLLVPNPYRLRLLLGGGFGIFNTVTTRRADIYKSNFPGQYGNFLSSVMNIESREGRRDRFGAGASFDVFQANVALEGPLPEKRGSYLLSIRRSYLDVFANQIVETKSVFPYMFDFDSKFVYDIDENTKISYKGLYTQEVAKLVAETDDDVEIDESVRVTMHTLGLESQLSPRAFASVRAAFYNETFDYNLYANKSDPNAASGDYASQINNFNVHQHVSLEIDDHHRIEQGVYITSGTSQLDLVTNVVNVGFTRRDLPPNMQFDENTGHIGTYVDYTATFATDFESIVGLRYDYNELFKSDDFSGKLGLTYHISPDMKAHAFWGRVVQFPGVLSVFTRDLPLDFSYEPEQLRSESALHYAMGFERQWPYYLSTRLQLYYKAYDRLLLPVDRVDYAPANVGEGYSQGLDLSIEKAKGPNEWFSGTLSYSYGKSEYRDTRDMVWIPFNYDRRHGIRALADFSFHENWGANAVWRYNSGLPYNEIRGYVWNVEDRSRYVKSTLNENRYPAYSRFDLRFYYQSRTQYTRLMVYLDLINVFNQRNVYERMYYTLDVEQEEGPDIRTFKYATIYSFPFIPSIGVSFRY